jgi:hypothetical protein
MIQIKVNDRVVGIVEGFKIIEEGTGPHDMTYSGKIQFDKIVFSREQISNAFTNQEVTVNGQAHPLQIHEYEDENGNVWHAQNIWLDSFQETWNSDDVVVATDVVCSCRSVTIT